MNNSAKMIKGIVAIIVATLTILSMSSFVFASDHTVTSVNDVEKIIETINAEYGTNIHILSLDELDSLGISEDEEYSVENVDLEKFETELRNIVEVDFPHFERNTQEALAKRMLNAETSDTREDSGDYRNNPIIARKAISYAEAGVQAYITTNNQGVINWSTVVDTYCYTDVHQMIWFYAPSITYSRIDANRTLSWEGSGNYYSNLEGVYLYLYSGTQYAEFYASSYV